MDRITNSAAAFLAVLFVMVLGVAFFEPIIDQIGNLQQSVQGKCYLTSNPDATWAVGESFNNGNHVRIASANTTNTTCREGMANLTEQSSTFERLNTQGVALPVLSPSAAYITWSGTAITNQPTTRVIVVAINLLPLILVIAFMMLVWGLFRKKGSKKMSGFA